jgi:RNA polymerase sigma-70 factor, ECF subfamily
VSDASIGSPDDAHLAAVREALAEQFPRLRGTWGLTLPDEEFVRYVAERVPAAPDAGAAALRLALGDLYLACGCARGDSAAVAALERVHLGNLAPTLARVRRSEAADDVKQHMMTVLFVVDGDTPRGITRYAGRGSLGGWLRVIALRTAGRIDAGWARHTSLEADDPVTAAVAADPSAEMVYLRERFRDEFKTAFAESLAALPPDDRDLLRQHFVDGLSVDDMAKGRGVHRATVARWLARVRGDLLANMRKSLEAKVGEDADSVYRIIESDLDLSISSELRS